MLQKTETCKSIVSANDCPAENLSEYADRRII